MRSWAGVKAIRATTATNRKTSEGRVFPSKVRLARDNDLGITILYCLPSPFRKTGGQKAGAYNYISSNGNNVLEMLGDPALCNKAPKIAA